MAAHRDDKGQLKGSPKAFDQPNRRHLLHGLVRCGECRRNGHEVVFRVCGAKYLGCPRQKQGTCTCGTKLHRERAERMLLDLVGHEILENEEWFELTFESLEESWQDLQQQSPDELALVTQRLQDVDAKIERLIDRIEDEDESGDIAGRLKTRKKERAELRRQKKQLQSTSAQNDTPPTREWLREQLATLGQVLSESSSAAAEALWNLVGGVVVLEECERPGRKQKFLRGRFQISARSFLAATMPSASTSSDATECPSTKEFVIDFVDPDPTDAQANQAKALYDEGLMCVDIAKRMGLSKSRITAILRHWHESRGLEKPDGRARRSTLDRKTQESPQYQSISDEVDRLCDEGLLLGEIAERLSVDRNTVTKAISYWHTSRGLPVPDGRTRRKALARKSGASETSRRKIGQQSPTSSADN
jgi:site-specific DNA recombinase